ncbi:hypothetical protein GCM10010193_38320 [Kitasatospora atroaurantiaca]|uniref:Uncharacterized protein n=1 Tax=Kitasatospora atroaurantiaca TaxID=285545 RepID=A0A561EUE1_9ACTN|nr:hypothetical protein [Kitasatospora atroaurantiaca]TWE19233.1 hypothetical protein FB465_4347 [Kitasatospora atroaurantiaca]
MLVRILGDSMLTAGGFATCYGTTVAVVSVTAVAARSPERRRDARDVLRILLRRRPR